MLLKTNASQSLTVLIPMETKTVKVGFKKMFIQW